MKLAAKLLLTAGIAGALLLAGLLFLGRERVYTVSLPKNQKSTAASSPIPIPKEFALPDSENYTNKLAEQFANQIIAKNPEGPKLDNETLGFLLNPKKVLDEMVQEALKAQVFETPVFSPKDFKIVPDSAQASKAYVDHIQRTANTLLGDWNEENPLLLLERAMTNGDYEQLLVFAGRLVQAEREIKTMAVPQAWFGFHRDAYTAVWQTRELMPRFLNWQNDPLGAIFAVNEYQKLGEKVQTLLNEFAARAKKEGLLM